MSHLVHSKLQDDQGRAGILSGKVSNVQQNSSGSSEKNLAVVSLFIVILS